MPPDFANHCNGHKNTDIFSFFSPPHSLPGGCINSSPAGKRRIGAEQQLLQFGDEAAAAAAASGDGTNAGEIGGSGQLASLRQVLLGASPTAITVMAISGCLLVVTVFVVIFSVLQVGCITLGGFERGCGCSV